MASQAFRKRRRRDFGWISSGIVLIFEAIALALAALATASLAWVVARRIGYPYDLEWMEGSMLHHALRVANHQPIYAPPSLDFIPHLYTPLYPIVVAAVGRIFGGVGYLVGRSVSVIAFAAALSIGVLWAKKEGGRLTAALVALALPVAAFADTGGFYDLVRCDSLQIFLTVAGAALAYYGRDRHAHMAAAALTLVAAFFAKQTAAPLIAFVGVALLPSALTRKPVLTFIAVGIGSFLLFLYVQNRVSDGWFWTYIFRLHQSHAFFTRRAWIETPATVLRLIGPAVLLIPWALFSRALGRNGEAGAGLGFLCWLGLGGFVAACIGFGTQWAHINAFIPGLFFPAIAIGAAAGQLLRRATTSRAQTSAQRHGWALRHSIVWILLASSLLLRLRTLHPAAHVPTAADRQAGDAVIARLASAPGDVLIPFHPFYAHLAGKRVFLHRMGIWDVRGSVAGPIHDLDAAFAQRRFSRIIFDEKVEATWADWPEVREHYRIVERFAGPRCVEGADTRPGLVMEPLPPVDHDLQ